MTFRLELHLPCKDGQLEYSVLWQAITDMKKATEAAKQEFAHDSFTRSSTRLRASLLV